MWKLQSNLRTSYQRSVQPDGKNYFGCTLREPHSMYVLYHKPLYSCIPWSVSHFPISKNCCLEVMEFAYKY